MRRSRTSHNKQHFPQHAKTTHSTTKHAATTTNNNNAPSPKRRQRRRRPRPRVRRQRRRHFGALRAAPVRPRDLQAARRPRRAGRDRRLFDKGHARARGRPAAGIADGRQVPGRRLQRADGRQHRKGHRGGAGVWIGSVWDWVWVVGCCVVQMCVCCAVVWCFCVVVFASRRAPRLASTRRHQHPTANQASKPIQNIKPSASIQIQSKIQIQKQLSEAVIGYADADNARRLQRLFSAPYFRVTLVNDVVRHCHY